jgi:phage shock protein C
MKMEQKKLYRSNSDFVFAGVCGGIAKYFNIDSLIVRLALVFVTLFSAGTGILGYIIAAFVIPMSPDETGQSKRSMGCLYALLVVFLAILAATIIGPIINLLIFGGWHFGAIQFFPFGFVGSFALIFSIASFLVMVIAVAVIIYFIRKNNNK